MQQSQYEHNANFPPSAKQFYVTPDLDANQVLTHACVKCHEVGTCFPPKTATGFKKPENAGRLYAQCSICKQWNGYVTAPKAILQNPLNFHPTQQQNNNQPTAPQQNNAPAASHTTDMLVISQQLESLKQQIQAGFENLAVLIAQQKTI